ncbi:hypothetical protein BS17DRAFT_786488 [Gyrodon lividus]|nr:hypothetical protein BS17DRAFT_786488 [Gyrodon lividus]
MKHDTEAKLVHATCDSAIRTFFSAFASRASMEGPPQRYMSMGLAAELPTEILMEIFKLVYEEHRTLPYRFYDKGPLKEAWIDEDPFSVSLFPFAIAAVCSRWCDILAGVPEYWTRLVLLVGEDPTDPVTISSCLQWSGDLPLSVTVTRENLGPNQSDEQESHRSRLVLDLLHPHIPRMESLTVSVLHSGSLPDIFNDWGGLAAKLETLMLSNVIDDDFAVENQVSRKLNGHLDAPSLDELSIRGRCFRDDLLGNSLQMSKIAGITSLCISGYRPLDEHAPGLPLWKTLRTLGQLLRMNDLTISDVRFDADRERYTGPPISLPHLHNVAFEKLASTDLKDIHSIIQGMSLSSTVITECTVNTLTNVNIVECLKFERMNVLQDLRIVLDAWFGTLLALHDSPCVDDHFFREMCRDLGGPVSYLAAPHLGEVKITNCDMFSVSALRDFIEARRSSHSARRIWSLEVTGRGPAITVEDTEWFHGCLRMFTWDTVQPDGKRYIVNSFSAQLTVG